MACPLLVGLLSCRSYSLPFRRRELFGRTDAAQGMLSHRNSDKIILSL